MLKPIERNRNNIVPDMFTLFNGAIIFFWFTFNRVSDLFIKQRSWSTFVIFLFIYSTRLSEHGLSKWSLIILIHASLISIIVTKCKSRDHLTCSSTNFLICWYFVKRYYFHVLSGNLCCFIIIYLNWIILHLQYVETPLSSQYNIKW
jgi:hypothetical protein